MSDETQVAPETQTPQGAAADADGGVVDTTAPTIKSVLGDTEAAPDETPETAESAETTETEPEKIDPYRIETPESMSETFKRDDAVFEKLAEVTRELGINAEGAQKLTDELWPYMWDRVVEQEAEMHRGFKQAAMQDKEIGGEKFEENLATAGRALDAFGSDALRELIDSHPLGSHPEVLRLLVKVGQTVSEDRTLVTGRDAGDGDISDPRVQAAVLYPTSARK